MTPQHQTIFGPPLGNCFQAALASVLDLPLDAVPNFMESEDWWEAVHDFLKPRGLYPLNCIATPDWKPSGYHLIGGQSPRGNFKHAVVGKDGEIVHDPHPDGTGLVTVEDYTVFAVLLE